ncbi:MAG: hypothetical protein ACRC7U_01365 [Moraxella sp.]
MQDKRYAHSHVCWVCIGHEKNIHASKPMLAVGLDRLLEEIPLR